MPGTALSQLAPRRSVRWFYEIRLSSLHFGVTLGGGGLVYVRQAAAKHMQILKILAGAVSFLIAGLSLVMVGLLGLAWWTQYSSKAASAPASSISTIRSVRGRCLAGRTMR